MSEQDGKQTDLDLTDMGAAALSLLDEKPEVPDAEHQEDVAGIEEKEPEAGVEGKEPEQPEATEQDPEKAGEEEGEGQVVETLEEFLEATEVDPEFFDGIKVKVKVNDEETDVPLSELRASFQMQSAAQKFLDDAKAERSAAKAERTQQNDTAALQLGVAAKLMEWVGKEIEGQQNDEELTRLRDEDPAEFAARSAEIQDRRKRFEDAKTEAFNALKANVDQQSQTSEQDLINLNVQRFTGFVENDPEVKALGEEKAKEEYQKVGEYLVASGFPQEDVMVASDHRHFLVARKAMLYDQMKANSKVSKKRVAKVPKVLKAGPKADSAQTPASEKDTAELLYG